LLLAPLGAFCLDPHLSLTQYNLRSWSRQSQLPVTGVKSITQTRDGHLWLGTARGLVRFDGTEFELIDLDRFRQTDSSAVSAIAARRDGGLWLGLARASFGFGDGREFTFLGREDWGGANLRVSSVLETAGGDLWVGASSLGARLVKGQTWERVLSDQPGQVYDVVALTEGHGRVWLGTSQAGLYSWNNGVLAKFPDPFLDEVISRALAMDSETNLWIGTERGLLCYDPQFQRKPVPFPWYPIASLLADRDGTVWIGTVGGGLARYRDGEIKHLHKTDGLPDDVVTALAEDDEGNLWIGTRNGLAQLSDVKIPTLGYREGLPAEVTVSVSPSRAGGLWIATANGLTRFDGSFQHISTNAGLRDLYVKAALEARDGNLYAITGLRDVEVISGGSVVASYPNELWPEALAEDSEGVVVSAGAELYRVSTHEYKPYPFENGPRPFFGWIHDVSSGPDGSLWVGSEHGLWRIRDGEARSWGVSDGLPAARITTVCVDSHGVVWAGSEAGLAGLSGDVLRSVSRKNGLFSDIIFAIVPDDHGDLWIDSSRGIFRVRRKELLEFVAGERNRIECESLDGPDAIKTSEKYENQSSGCKTADGRVWFVTALGVAMVNPTNLVANTVPPRIHIRRVRANGKLLEGTQRASLARGRGDLEFHYAGLSYVAPLKVRYRYRLQGYDKAWIEAGGRRSAFYTNLKPGKYVFEVVAGNADGVWNPTPARYGLELTPHFFQTFWFKALMVLVGGAVILGVYGWRIRDLESQQTRLRHAHLRLEASFQARTDELAATNAALREQIEERKRMELEVEQTHQRLLTASRQAGQAEVASSVLHNVGNVLNSVNVSAHLITERVRQLRLENLAKAAALISTHEDDLNRFLTEDTKGRRLGSYLEALAKHLTAEQTGLLKELKDLGHHVDHIKEIVAMQQSYARVAGVIETVAPNELMESALKMHSGAYLRHVVAIVREYEDLPPIAVDKHKVLQVLINLLHNAKYACDEAGRPDKQVTVRISRSAPEEVCFEVLDNGVGIPQENLTRIFGHGFTTRKDGHGFGLHSAAIAARELGGSLTAASGGPGQGAAFRLAIPVTPGAVASRETEMSSFAL
jgi:ligand-binding sensor domain-containing protein/signal transduction histidine kinase